MKTMRLVLATIFCLLCAIFVAAQPNRPVTFRQLAELTASDGGPQNFLGESLAMSGNTVVAGAPGAGKAYVFVKPATGWISATQTAELTPSDGAVGLTFGYWIAISGNTVAVDAAPSDASMGFSAIYVFVEPAGGWTNMTETAKLTLSNENLLFTVAVSGNTIAAGANEETVGSNSYQGAVYIYQRPQSGWKTGLQPKARLTASDGKSQDYLGFGLAFYGNAVVATAINRAAYVFVEPSSGWVTSTQTAKLTASNETGLDEFGASVAIKGSTILVGAPESGSGLEGAAYVYYKPSGGWTSATQSTELIASDFANDNFFGTSVAVTGSLVAVGADGATVGGNVDEGAAYAFAGGSQVAKLTPAVGLPFQLMGWSVATSDSTIVSGANNATVGSNAQQGELFVFAP
jgi:hypothetical protein